jgi:hypothetical protein
VFLDLIQWETHAWPGFGADAQDVINREIEPGDIFIGIMWRRIGLYKEVRSHVPRPDEDPHRRLVLGVLESSRNVGQGYRTVAGLARATGLSERETKRVLESNPALILGGLVRRW